MSFWVKWRINNELAQSVAAPEGNASDAKDGDAKSISMIKSVV